MNNTRKLLPLLAILSVLPGLSGCDSDDGGGGAAPASFTLTVVKTGNGTVTGTGISCGADCVETLPQGTVVNLTATTPNAGDTFVWGGGCSGTGTTCAVTLNANTTVTATYASSTGADPAEIVALTTTNKLISFTRAAPDSVPVTSRAITGLATSEQVVGIDFRPSDGFLYGLTNQSRVYRLDAKTGVASPPVELRTDPADPNTKVPLTGTEFGVDFNPTNNLLRIVSSAAPGENFAVNVTTGLTTVQTALNGAATKATAAAYNNNTIGATGTVLYVIDTSGANDTLYIQDPPAGGTLTAVGPIGQDSSDFNGFEIVGSQDALVALTIAGAPRLFTLNLGTGATTTVATINTGEPVGTAVRGIAVKVTATASAAGDTFATLTGNQLVSFNRAAPGTLLTQVLIAGLPAGEQIVGIDFRPTDQKLYGLGSQGNLYTINTASGLTALVAELTADLADPTTAADPMDPSTCDDPTFGGLPVGASFGVDFEPLADRLRVVSSTGLNLSINPGDAKVRTDCALNRADDADSNAPFPAFATGVAYTNSFLGTISSGVFYIDTTNDTLAGPDGSNIVTPNNGSIENIDDLGVDAEAINGFDIDPITGEAYAALRVSGQIRLYLVSLSAVTAGGVATDKGLIGGGSGDIRGLALKPAAAAVVFGLTTDNRIISFDPAVPGTLTLDVPVDPADLQGGESLVGIDFRLSDGALVAVTSTNRILTINTATGDATQSTILIPSPDDPTNPFVTLSGTEFGVSFDPKVGANAAGLRTVNNTGALYLRSNSMTGETFTDTVLARPAAPTFPCSGASGALNIGAVANNAASTVYVIDSNANAACLYTAPTGGGAMSQVGFLLGPPNQGVASAVAGFDIAGGHDGLRLAALLSGTQSILYRINLVASSNSPRATSAAAIGPVPPLVPTQVRGLAIQLKYVN